MTPEVVAPVSVELWQLAPVKLAFVRLALFMLAELGVAVTVTDEPTFSEHPLGLGQTGETEPDPASTPVINV
jgi:hypothetical protein